VHNPQQTQETNIHALGGVRTHDPSSLAAADLRLRPRDHRDRFFCHVGRSVLQTIRNVWILQKATFVVTLCRDVDT
jgi:hypothetical protein